MVGPQPASPAAAPRYREVCPLASGGMAELHLARMSGVGGFERLVVIKRVKSQLAGAPDLAQALLDEARIAATLQHGNIVQVHDVMFEDGLVSVVMEFLHGQEVATVMRRAAARLPGGVMPFDQAIAVAVGVCAGLHHAHERVDATGAPLEIVHRDVSADNVIVTYDGGIKLIDFGIARAHSRMGRTDHGVTKGKPGYMAPEQILCTRIDRRTDVHAAAVLLYEMTCGRQPREGASDYHLLNATVERDATPPSAVRPGYPPELEAIVMRGLAREPAARFQSALEMQRALEEVATARKLDLSSFGLARVMEQLFADKLEAWHAAQQAGTSLADHVAAVKRTTMGIDMVEEAPTARGPVSSGAGAGAGAAASTAPLRRRAPLAYALLGLVAVIAISIGVWRAGHDDSKKPPAPVTHPEPVTQPAPVTPAPQPQAQPQPQPEPQVTAPPVAAPTAVDTAPAPAPAPEPTELDMTADPAASKTARHHGAPGHRSRTRRDDARGERIAPVNTPKPPVTKPDPVTAPTAPPVDPDGSLPR